MQKAIIKITLFVFFIIFCILPNNADAAILVRPPSNLGLVGYWPMDEGVGVLAGDSSGNGNDGAITGATWANGKRGGALSFDGADDGVSLSSNGQNWGSVFGSSLDFTISLWIKPSNLGYYALVSQRYGDAMVFGMGDGTSFPAGTLFLNMDDTRTGSPYSTGSVEANKWQHVAVSFKGSDSSYSVSFYINGKLSGTGTSYDSNGIDYQDLLFLGYQTRTGIGGPDAFYYGLMDDIRVYNRVLSATEISAMYKSGQVTRKQVSNQGLVGYWSFNEGSGTKAGDSSGNNKSASLYGGTSWVDGKKNKALNFNGIDAYFDSPAFSLNDVNGDISVSFWMKTSSSTKATILYKGGGSGRLWVWHEGGKIAVNSYFGAGKDYYLYGNINVIDNKWHNIVVVFEKNGNEKIYVDGVFDNQASIAGAVNDPWSQNAIRIGQTLNITYWQYYDGLLDDVRIYNRALSAGEIQNLYKQNETMVNAPQNNKLTNGLVGLWSFNGKDVSGATAYDRSGQGNNGTISGAKLDAGKVGQGMLFDGNNDYIEVTDTDVLSPSSGMSASIWFKWDGQRFSAASVKDWATLFSKGNYSDGEYTVLMSRYDQNTINTINFYINGGARASWSNSGISTDWHNLSFTYDSSVARIFFDGTQVATGSYSTPITNTAYNFRVGHSATQYPFGGNLDEVRVYNRALSADEIKQLYLMGK